MSWVAEKKAISQNGKDYTSRFRDDIRHIFPQTPYLERYLVREAERHGPEPFPESSAGDGQSSEYASGEEHFFWFVMLSCFATFAACKAVDKQKLQ